ncbi:hypothetical protein [Streptomyces acidiscabies]|uniref:hypothetical protein n=1 Tax=Streptomyces acidiscabies TaxID=42234 RepID=UPI000952CA63|nr:hypothetical protein [Streptomyces acidiscabies]
MTREERLAILGPEIVKHIHERVDEAPDPSPEVVSKLRRIMTNPAGPSSELPLKVVERFTANAA